MDCSRNEYEYSHWWPPTDFTALRHCAAAPRIPHPAQQWRISNCLLSPGIEFCLLVLDRFHHDLLAKIELVTRKAKFAHSEGSAPLPSPSLPPSVPYHFVNYGCKLPGSHLLASFCGKGGLSLSPMLWTYELFYGESASLRRRGAINFKGKKDPVSLHFVIKMTHYLFSTLKICWPKFA